VTLGRFLQLVGSCIVLGVGVGLLLTASLGSDGYSTLINGIAITTSVAFAVVNIGVGAVFVAVAWWRGLVPGWGTVVQPVVVGLTITGVLDVTSTPDSRLLRALLLLAAFPILVVGVAGYLGSGTGAGPTEAAALAFDPPVPFRWSYSILQAGGAFAGWLMGAAIGPGTLLVIFLIGPAVDLVSARVPWLDIHARARSSCPT
jgi:uncharacterized membrane protein YczE